MKKISKKDTEIKIKEFFLNIENKSPVEIKKIKKLAMNKNIALKEKRKLFCKKCLTLYKNPKIRINKKMKSIWCEKCGNIKRWKL
jgi:RNase P subunit RPR2